MAVNSSFTDVVVEERCLRLVAFVDDPEELDVGEKEVYLTSGSRRLVFALPELVLPTAPLNRAKYSRSKRRLDLTLRRPFASSTWQMFEEADRQVARMQAEARRLLGPSVLDRGVQIEGEAERRDRFSFDVRVEEEGGVVINVQSPGPSEAERPLMVLGETDRTFLPWSASAAPCSSSSSSASGEDEDNCSNADPMTQFARVEARLERQARRRGLRVACPRASRADGRKVKGRSVFTDRARLQGEVVLYFRGRVLRRQEMLPTSRAQRFYFQLDDEWLLDGGTGGARPKAAHIAALINSPAGCVAEDGADLQPNLIPSVDPSKGLGQRAIRFTAARDIDAGEELLYRYGDTHDLVALSPESSGDELAGSE